MGLDGQLVSRCPSCAVPLLVVPHLDLGVKSDTTVGFFIHGFQLVVNTICSYMNS